MPSTGPIALPDAPAASAVPAILAEGSLPSAAEAVAVAVLAEFRRKGEETRELHASSPGAGEGNCRRFVVIDTSHSDLTVSAVPRHAMTFLSVAFRGMGFRGLTLIGRRHFSDVYSCKDLRELIPDIPWPHIPAPPTAHLSPPAHGRRHFRRMRGSGSGAPTGAPGAICNTIDSATITFSAAAARCSATLKAKNAFR